MMRTERCACGGTVSADVDVVGAAGVAEAVAQHGRTARHEEWAQLRGYSRELMGRAAPDPEFMGRDVAPILGPCPCKGCGAHLYWRAGAWSDAQGRRHVCSKLVRVS